MVQLFQSKYETRTFAQTLQLARAEFLEMPGLKLTVSTGGSIVGRRSDDLP